jgi:hypothetical protein
MSPGRVSPFELSAAYLLAKSGFIAAEFHNPQDGFVIASTHQGRKNAQCSEAG